MKKQNYVKQLRKEMQLSQTQFANKINLSQGALSQIENGYSSLSMESLKKISDAFNVNCNWLVKGNGEMFQNNEPKVLKYHLIADNHGHNLIPLVRNEARAGYLENHFDRKYLQTLDVYKIPGYEKGDYRLFELEGDSMIPTFYPREVVIGERIAQDKLENGHLVVLISKEGIVAKRIYPNSDKKGNYLLKSDNITYKSYSISKKDILETWAIKGKITAEFSSVNDHFHKIDTMEKDIIYLKESLQSIAKSLGALTPAR